MSINLIKEKCFTFKKVRSWRYPTETVTDVDYTDDLELHANTPAQAEPLLQSRVQASGSIDFYVNVNKTENMCFKEKG